MPDRSLAVNPLLPDRRSFPWIAPFVWVSVGACVVALLSDVDRRPGFVVAAVAVDLFVLALMRWVPWRRFPARLQALPPLGFLGAIVLMRLAEGPQGAYGPLVLVPLVWLALYATYAEIIIGVACLGAVFLGPVYLADFPTVGVRAGVLFMLVGLIVAVCIHRLMVAYTTSERALRKTQAVELNDAVVQQLTIAKLAFEAGRTGTTEDALDLALANSKAIVTRILESSGHDLAPGGFRHKER